MRNWIQKCMSEKKNPGNDAVELCLARISYRVVKISRSRDVVLRRDRLGSAETCQPWRKNDEPLSGLCRNGDIIVKPA